MDICETPSLSFSEALNKSTCKIFQFTGRSRRSEYWWTMLLVYLLNIVLTPFIGIFIDIATIPLTFRRLHDTGRSGWWWGICAILQVAFFISLLYDLIMAGVNADNLHGNEDEFIFVFLMKYIIWAAVIVVYKIVLFVFMCLDGDVYENEYGESPKYVESDE